MMSISVLGAEEEVETFLTSSHTGRDVSEEYQKDSVVYTNVVVQLLSRVQFFGTPWMAARQASLSFTVSRSLLKLMSTELVMPSNHLILCHPLLFLQSCHQFSQFSSVTQSCLTLCHSINCSTPGLPVHHQLLEFMQTHVHQVSDAIQPSHPLLSPSPPAPNSSQHQSLFQ